MLLLITQLVWHVNLLLLLRIVSNLLNLHAYIIDLVPKGVHENRTKGVESKVDDTLKQQCF